MGLFLSNEELESLTGYKLASKQVHWLKAKGYHVEVNARGLPRITHLQIEEVRRYNSPALAHVHTQYMPTNNTNQHSSIVEPDFIGLRLKIKKASIDG